MPMFIDAADMINTYGTKEMVFLTDRVEPLTGSLNTTVMDANIDDAEAEILVPLSCCFDSKAILDVYAANKTIPLIQHWAKVITRLHLYSSLERDDSQVTKAYDDAKKEMEDICKCGVLIDSDGNQIPKLPNFSFVEWNKCGCGCCPCRCGYFKDHL